MAVRQIFPLLFSVFLQTALLPAAPRWSIREYSTRDGLVQRMVSSVVQDRRGFMWFGTWNGLARFDGDTFDSYTNSMGEYGNLRNNRINYICENSLGDIWCLTHDSRVYLFDTWTERYLDVTPPLEEMYKRHFAITMVYALPKGVTWLVSDDGHAFRLEDARIKDGEGITAFSTYDNSLKGNVVYLVHQDADGDEWILTDGGFSLFGQKTVQSDTPVVHLAENGPTILLAPQRGKLLLYDKQKQALSRPDPGFPLGTVNRMVPFGDSDYALATSAGAVVFSPRTGQFVRYDLADSGLRDPAVADIYIDSGGALWCITPANGIVRLDPHEGASRFVYRFGEPVVTHYPPYAVYEDREGTLWVIPADGSIRYYNPARHTLQAVETGPDVPDSAPVFTGQYYADDRGNLWIAHSTGVCRIAFSIDYARYVAEDRDHETRALLADSRGYLWSGSKQGVVRRYDPATGACRYLDASGALRDSYTLFVFPPDSFGVYAFCEDSSGAIWIGTKGAGLFRLEADGKDRFRVARYRHDDTDPVQPLRQRGLLHFRRQPTANLGRMFPSGDQSGGAGWTGRSTFYPPQQPFRALPGRTVPLRPPHGRGTRRGDAGRNRRRTAHLLLWGRGL